MASNRQDVLTALEEERDYQDSDPHDLGYTPEDDARLSTADWILFMERKLEEAKERAYTLDDKGARSSVRKVAALGVACLEHRGVVRRSEEGQR